MKNRTIIDELVDFITFPIRALTLFENDKLGLSSLQSERYYYVAKEVVGNNCLDIGCGRYNRFVKEFIEGNGIGVDVYKYEGLSSKNLVKDMSNLKFANDTFGTVTLIACINHIPEDDRILELKEFYRVLSVGGKIIVTMGNPIAEVLVHKLVWLYDKLLKTNFDADNIRGMKVGEKYYLTDSEIKKLLKDVGFKNVKKKYFVTQWGLNHMFIAEKC